MTPVAENVERELELQPQELVFHHLVPELAATGQGVFEDAFSVHRRRDVEDHADEDSLDRAHGGLAKFVTSWGDQGRLVAGSLSGFLAIGWLLSGKVSRVGGWSREPLRRRHRRGLRRQGPGTTALLALRGLGASAPEGGAPRAKGVFASTARGGLHAPCGRIRRRRQSDVAAQDAAQVASNLARNAWLAGSPSPARQH